jgi:hypothetical protein
VREELEALEDHPHPRPHGAQRTLVLRQKCAFELDVAAVDRLEPVRTAKERRLPRAGRADQANDLACVHVEINARKRGKAAVALDHAAIADDLRAVGFRAWGHSGGFDYSVTA